MSPTPASPDQTVADKPHSTVLALDHVALPMEDSVAMVRFYRALGLEVSEHPLMVRVALGDQMVNFHRPELWRGDFPLRAPAATPPCGDLCFVWPGSEASLLALLGRAAAPIVAGPVAREGGRRVTGSSVYTRDPDGNLLEFLRYPDGGDRRSGERVGPE